MATINFTGAAIGGAHALGSALNSLGTTYEQQGSNGGTSSNWNSGYGWEESSAERAMEYNREMQNLANAFSANEAQKNRDWQERMSSTAFQRAVDDMRKAGINPILAAGAQASTPAGGAATGHMAAIGNESRAFNQQSGGGQSQNWGTNSAHSYSNFAEGIAKLMESVEEGGTELWEETKKGIMDTIGEWFDGVRRNWTPANEVGEKPKRAGATQNQSRSSGRSSGGF
ncbi:DNA pilot protein [Sigmofec virus UA08Rod_5306]|uniref:DNA pilot protein n=1 Tax=Sigmofec virus UA08Rod_5306 TaxID=2929417 RepID=A0A976N0U7_9VIRU|nr:DNA pilot protein [Sigmofec virus UA08Rod_5306]